MIDMRDAFFDVIYEHAIRNESIFLVTNDMEVHSLKELQHHAPDRIINVGVAEQNMINVAAGLASVGKRVIVFGISSFIAFRAYEQIRMNLCSMNLPVTIVGLGQGYSFSYDGPTHHGVHDLAVLRTIPELEILNPGDSSVAAASAVYALEAKGPLYVRVDKGKYPDLHGDGLTLSSGFAVLRPVQRVTVVATGALVARALRATKKLSERGVEVGLVDAYRIQPFPSRLRPELQSADLILVAEEGVSSGGLYSALLEAHQASSVQIRHLGSGMLGPQKIAYGSREWMLEQEGLGEDSLVAEIEFINRSFLRGPTGGGE
jgi:transketolase